MMLLPNIYLGHDIDRISAEPDRQWTHLPIAALQRKMDLIRQWIARAVMFSTRQCFEHGIHCTVDRIRVPVPSPNLESKA
jgi:hypothetical protein